jgi:hypothetical protein
LVVSRSRALHQGQRQTHPDALARAHRSTIVGATRRNSCGEECAGRGDELGVCGASWVRSGYVEEGAGLISLSGKADVTARWELTWDRGAHNQLSVSLSFQPIKFQECLHLCVRASRMQNRH